ncbi:hypothetical protein DPMN_153471 [Dreissena polymorpha]|uniref:Uncharacterized protein n=1 Tax=Dreissena polymorpha TaxID=45954 RepID=A0A9D4FJ88_DREPO|nr:hypothetical protein DPMN_153471 [Dreissena polymorpha]
MTVIVIFDLVTAIPIGVIYCPKPKHMGSIKPISHFFDELLIGTIFIRVVSVTLTFDLVTPNSIAVIYFQGKCTCEASSQSVNFFDDIDQKGSCLPTDQRTD